jgi:ectoine hydroxylase-related dioxygenase (phytanoyl-CoA dioxygenase family)
MENGCLLVEPGSHKGPVLSHHHSQGFFVGAVTEPGYEPTNAVPILVEAGGISIHHVRTLHGSAPNTSPNSRRLLLFQYCANDAWPLVAFPGWEEFNANIVQGQPTQTPRVTNVPVRVPLPAGERGGSLYETQMMMEKRLYTVPAMAPATAPVTVG